MAAFTDVQMATIQGFVAQRRTMAAICLYFSGKHPRDEIVEAIDALRRTSSIVAARKRVNAILSDQAAGHQLVNGTRIEYVCRNWPFVRTYKPDF